MDTSTGQLAPAPPLVVQELSFRYRARTEPALKDVSFTLGQGELLLVAGASGCGKTTLIRCINGLIPRSYKGELSGRILLHGEDLSGQSLARVSRVVGTVLQDPERQILGARVSAEVAFGLENLGLPRSEIRSRVHAALDRLNIRHLRDRETHLLSGGEKQKVALAGILAMRPSVLLLDEPLASLDPASAVEAMAMIRRLADENPDNATTVFRTVLKRPDFDWLSDGEALSDSFTYAATDGHPGTATNLDATQLGNLVVNPTLYEFGGLKLWAPGMTSIPASRTSATTSIRSKPTRPWPKRCTRRPSVPAAWSPCR